MHGYLRNTDNPNFIIYTSTVPLARHRLRNVLFSHISHFKDRLIVEFLFLNSNFVLNFLIFHFFFLFVLPSIPS
jgi:hypothetical protein